MIVPIIPPAAPIQVPLIEKHPPVRFTPFAKVELAVVVIKVKVGEELVITTLLGRSVLVRPVIPDTLTLFNVVPDKLSIRFMSDMVLLIAAFSSMRP